MSEATITRPAAAHPIPGLSLVDQALRTVAQPLRSPANSRNVLFRLTYSNGDYMTPEQASAKYASDGDTRAWLAKAQPGDRRKLNSITELACYDAENVEAYREHQRVMEQWRKDHPPRPDDRAESISEYADFCRGVRQEGSI